MYLYARMEPQERQMEEGGVSVKGSAVSRGCRQMALSLEGIGLIIPRVQGHQPDQGSQQWRMLLTLGL